MRKKYFACLPLLFLVGFSTSGCSSKANENVLRIINAEDYIYEQDDKFVTLEDGTQIPTNPDMIVQFKNYYKEKTGKDITVVYNTYDTNETMLSSLKTGKTHYDLVCASDYTLQKMVRAGLVQKINEDKPDKTKEELVPNYYQYTSNYLKGIMEGIDCSTYNEDGSVKENFGRLSDYCCGYMWGTLGLIYNPETIRTKVPSLAKLICDHPDKEGRTCGECDNCIEAFQIVEEKMSDWSVLWDPEFKGLAAIKDSMRDTYSIAIMETYKEDFVALKTQHESGELTDEEYNSKVSKIFNYGGEKDKDADKHIEEVKQTLYELRKNIFGFEIDGGKQDIVTGKIAIDTAWSGDAVYSIDQAAEETETVLRYSIPDTGGNIWFDTWAIQKGGNAELARAFIDFVSDPLNASQNMNYVGYTSFISGTNEDGVSMFDLVSEWYSEAWYNDDGEFVTEEEVDDPKNPGKKILEEVLANIEDYTPVDLSRYFSMEGEDHEEDEFVIYISNESGGKHAEIFAQYPDVNRLPSLAIMEDYGDNQEKIIRMWEHIKAEGMPLWAIILLSCEAGLALVLIGVFVGRKRAEKYLRKQRRKAEIQKSK